MVDRDSLTITWGIFEFDSNNFYGGRPHDSPSSSKDSWTSNTAREEDLTIIVQYLYIEVVVLLKTIVIIAKIQLWKVLVLFFPIRFCVVTSFYTEIDQIDHNKSFQ